MSVCRPTEREEMSELYVAWSELEPVIHPPIKPDTCGVRKCSRPARYRTISEIGDVWVCQDHYVPEVF